MLVGTAVENQHVCISQSIVWRHVFCSLLSWSLLSPRRICWNTRTQVSSLSIPALTSTTISKTAERQAPHFSCFAPQTLCWVLVWEVGGVLWWDQREVGDEKEVEVTPHHHLTSPYSISFHFIASWLGSSWFGCWFWDEKEVCVCVCVCVGGWQANKTMGALWEGPAVTGLLEGGTGGVVRA